MTPYTLTRPQAAAVHSGLHLLLALMEAHLLPTSFNASIEGTEYLIALMEARIRSSRVDAGLPATGGELIDWHTLDELVAIVEQRLRQPESAPLQLPGRDRPGDLDRREFATVLAALRLWQRLLPETLTDEQRAARLSPEWDIATDGGTLTPLQPDEVDRLCLALNGDD